MPLEKKPVRTARPVPASFRLSEEAVRQLKVLASVLNMTQTEVIEVLLADGYEQSKKKYATEVRRAESKIET
jgi:predicted transcriptional regulator